MYDKRAELASGVFDILVIGAGIYGACIAWEAARRGYRVAVIDKGDFGAATSSNHYKFLHGGIRYLQHLDLVRVRASSQERSALIRLAPHLCYPMPIVFPTYGHGRRGKALMRAAMAAYDLLNRDRNRGIKDPDRKTPAGTTLSREQVLALFPGTPVEGLTGAAKFYDGQMYNPPRVVLAFLQSASSAGAIAANYVRAERFLRQGDRVVGVTATDCLSDSRFDVRSRIVINAAGPWAHRLLRHDADLALDVDPGFSRDLCFVAKKSVCATHAIGCQTASGDSDALLDRGARHVFLVPWRGMTLVGVWHGYSELHPDRIAVSEEELQRYLDEINGAYRGLDLGVDDVSMINTGLILFGQKDRQGGGSRHSFSKRAFVFDHRSKGVRGLVTVVGDRATMGRRVAETTVRLVAGDLGARGSTVAGEAATIHGGDFESFDALVEEVRGRLPDTSREAAGAIAHNYGAAYTRVLACAGNSADLDPIGDTKVVAAEVLHAIRFELARSLEDIVMRRTELGSGGDPGAEALRRAGELAAGEFGWSPAETAAQVASLQALFRRRGPWQVVDTSEQPATSAA